jgi:hypothetical protein
MLFDGSGKYYPKLARDVILKLQTVKMSINYYHSVHELVDALFGRCGAKRKTRLHGSSKLDL